MAREVIDFLRPEPRKRYLDGTLGGGGHTEQILMHSRPDGEVLGLDLDDEALAAARHRLAGFGDRLMARQASFAVGIPRTGFQLSRRSEARYANGSTSIAGCL